MEIRAPTDIGMRYQDGKLFYNERFEYEDGEKEEMEAEMEATVQMMRSTLPSDTKIGTEISENEAILTMEGESDPERTLMFGIVELMLMLRQVGGDIDRPWHVVHATDGINGE